MAYRGLVIGALTAFVWSASGAVAQSSGIPANFPPAGFTGNQFVDNNGCAFIRAGIGGNTTWVPRVDRRRNQLCNFQPTFGPEVTQAPVATPEPAPIIAAAPAPAPLVVTPPVAAAAPAAPVPRNSLGAPIQTVASLTTQPLIEIPTATTATARSPQVVRPQPATVAAPAEPPRQNVAAFCVGRTGLQPGFVSSRTGNTVDCGGTPAPTTIANVAPPVVADSPRRLTLAQACAEMGRTGQALINGNTGQPVVCPSAAPVLAASVAPTPRQMTHTQVCLEMSRTGRRFVNANTGEAISCAVTNPTQGLSAPITASVPAAAGDFTRATYIASNCSSRMLTVEGVEVRCGPQAQGIVANHGTSGTATIGTTRARSVQVSRGTVSTSSFSVPFFSQPQVPASNPRGVSPRQVVKPPKGYTRVWNDGRHNPNRGLKRAAAPTVQSAPSRVSTDAGSRGHRYVQVGTFPDASRAGVVGRQLASEGMRVGLGNATSGGRSVKVVVLGPFGNANELARGLRAAKSAGFSGAFTRN